MSENEFYLLQGNSYRGSRYGNFTGGGVTPQGNVSSAITENDASQVGTSGDISGSGTPQGVGSQDGNGSQESEFPSIGTKEVIGAALPFAATAIGETAGAAIGAGSTFGEGLNEGVSSLANRVSGGLLGNAGASAAVTNSAISSSLGGASGPATKAAVTAVGDKALGTLGSGANIGAAAGAGIATFATTLLSGGSVGDAAKAGAGTAVGTAIGQALIPIPVVGGFIGGFIGGSIFCFAAGTPILMENGTRKAVESLRLGDEIFLGGTVCAVGQALTDSLHKYKNTILSSKHSVFENGVWLRVEDSELSEAYEFAEGENIVYPICTETNLIVNPWFISADVLELPLDVADGMTYEQIVEHLNSQTELNNHLFNVEKEVCVA